ncbi:MAG: ATP-dependent DNA helicase [Rothia sp. (in: high G+C Gram-positive bacteria)]|uniref:ATP-dependent DNA helicase n=1 Tax=Rothia sp. (in: high G+C Gram-positive bacteria) TaxID=1885016 RepID=UPI0026F8994E|nr:ATP-dependent DNA helicase [Rothia sp. (in: high G+C Gram-positive bacteria)]
MTEKKPAENLLTPEAIAEALGRPLPTAEQSAIISSPLVPRLVVAGAGSGKTATMVDRVVWLVANGLVRADQVLGVTFTRKAAGELRERMRSRLEELRRQGLVRENPEQGGEEITSDPTISTYHSYANTLVQQYGLRIGVEDDAQMLGGAQTWQLVAQIVEHYEGKLPEKDVAKSTMVESIIKLSAECAEHLVSPDTVIDWCTETLKQVEDLGKPTVKGATSEQRALVQGLQLRIFYAELVKRYSAIKEQMQVMDYGDLIAKAAQIARTVPQAAQTERERFRVVLLDEFQDTSHAQMQLFSDLFGATADAPAHPVMAVGDPKQSIYGFRGASDGQLFSFYDYFPADDRTASYLTVAWRNDTAILAAANRVADPLSVSPDWVKRTHTIEVPPLVARPNPTEGRVLVGEYLTDLQEARALGQMIAEQRSTFAGRPLSDMPTMAVLCKKRAMMEPLQEAFDELGVPYQVVGLGGLLDTPEIVDLVAVLRVLSDPGRSDALMRILAGARWRLGVSDLLALGEWAETLKRQRELEIRFGITAQAAALRAEQEILDEVEALGEAAERGATSARELKDVGEQAPASAQDYRRLLQAAAPDVTDGASLIEALENLPQEGWESARTGRSISAEGLRRLRAVAGELAYLRQFTADDLTTLISEIERTLLLDIELAARPGVHASSARRHLDAFYDVAATYESTAPRINALLLAAANGQPIEEGEGGVRFALSATGASASGISGFLAWLDAAAQQEAGLDMAAEAPRHDAVQILTVHASKGLEWDQVYIPGMAAGDFPDGKDERWTKQGDTLPWPMRGDSAYLPGWNVDFENLQDLGNYMAGLSEQAIEYRTLEERRLAYVGYTRARSLLVLTTSAWKGTSTKSRLMSDFVAELLDRPQPLAEVLSEVDLDQVGTVNPQSATITTALWPFDPFDGPQQMTWSSLEELEAAGPTPVPTVSTQGAVTGLTPRQVIERAAQNVLRGGLDTEALAEALAALPEATVEQAQEIHKTIEDWQEETDLLLSLLAAPAEHSSFELPGHLSASLLVNLVKDPQAVIDNIQRPMPQKPGIAARQGTIFHSWVEDHFGTSGMLDMDEDFDDDGTEEELNIPALRENFLASDWASREPWALEYPLETPLAGVTVRGRIDAIFTRVDGDGSTIWQLVDWKTGRPPRTKKELKERSVQLSLYRLGFARLQGVPEENVEAHFFYASTGESIEVTNFSTRAELEKAVERAAQLAG